MSAFRYSRIENGVVTHAVETEPVPVGKPLEALGPIDVELFRVDPIKLL